MQYKAIQQIEMIKSLKREHIVSLLLLIIELLHKVSVMLRRTRGQQKENTKGPTMALLSLTIACVFSSRHFLCRLTLAKLYRTQGNIIFEKSKLICKEDYYGYPN